MVCESDSMAIVWQPLALRPDRNQREGQSVTMTRIALVAVEAILRVTVSSMSLRSQTQQNWYSMQSPLNLLDRNLLKSVTQSMAADSSAKQDWLRCQKTPIGRCEDMAGVSLRVGHH